MFRYLYCVAFLAVLQHSTEQSNDATNGDKSFVMALVAFANCDRTLDDDELSLAIGEGWQNIMDLTYSLGPAILTADGKRRCYEVGKFIRRRYGPQGFNIISNVYHPQDIDITTGTNDYTKMSAEVALAAMFPPEVQQYWNDGLGRVWQPVPYHTTDDYGYILFYERNERFKFELSKALKKNEMVFNEFTDLYPILKEHTGADFSKNPQLFRTLMHLLKSQESLGNSTPEWTKNITMRIYRGAHEAYFSHFDTEEMTRLAAGVMLNSFMDAVANITVGRVDKKLHVFSVNDINVGALMEATGVFGPIPGYGTLYALELYQSKSNGNYYVAAVYVEKAGDPVAEPQIVPMASCNNESFCELSWFKFTSKAVTIDNKGFETISTQFDYYIP